MSNKMNSSNYIEQQRRGYALYVLNSRAIPFAADGLKAAARRVLWIGRDGKKQKSATLAGATMPIHPHDAPEGTINTITGPYKNNIPLLEGDGAFGTLLNPNAFGASRYTSVKVGAFAKECMFADIDIIPMKDNYDNTLQEPVTFLPLIPMAVINPQEGIAVGFSSNILPRNPIDVIDNQLSHLDGKTFKEPPPHMIHIDQRATEMVHDGNGGHKWKFCGTFEKLNSTEVKITNLPYGITHEKFMAKLDKLIDEDKAVGYEDNSQDNYDIVVKFKRGILNTKSDDNIRKLLSLDVTVGEVFNLIHFDGNSVWSPSYVEFIAAFTDWRLTHYLTRYVRLADLKRFDIQRYLDIMLAIKHEIGKVAPQLKNRSELKELLVEIGIVNVDFIADLPVYRFTEEERNKTQEKLDEARNTLAEYEALIENDDLRKDVYKKELKEVLTAFKKGRYSPEL